MDLIFPDLVHPQWDCAKAAAHAASEVLSRKFKTRMDIQQKGLSNFVSEADLAAEKIAIETVRNRFPRHRLLTEESHQSLVGDAEHLWIIDPLDGTSNYLHGIPHFAVSIAYYRNMQPEIALVANPITGDTYGAIVGQGAWHNGIRQHVSTECSLDQTIICCGFYYDRGNMMQATLDTVRDFFHSNIHGMRRFGAAALDLCNVGCGQYGLFFEYQLHPWDFAAGQLFLTEAGGCATNCDGQPLRMDGPSSICATNSLLHSHALQVIQPRWHAFRHSTT